jgi:hypothetical protein
MERMSDEEYRASNLRKEQFKEMAKNPPESMTVYRMQKGDPGGSLGIHWSTDENVSHYTGLGGSGDDRFVHRATVSRDQVITEGEWKGGNIRSHYTDSEGKFKTGKSQWGLDMEAEVRLRPGATVRDHAVAPAGVHEYEPTGREPTIESRGNNNYVDLVHHAVHGTPEFRRLDDEQAILPHVQQTMFDNVHAIENQQTGRHIGYTPKWDLLRSSMSLGEAIDFGEKDVNRIGAAAGLEKWGAITESAHEPLLSELHPRDRTEEFHAGHQESRHDPNQGTLF